MYKLRVPLLLINTKSYKEGVGRNAILLGRITEKVSNELGVSIVLAVQPTDIFPLSNMGVHVIAQHFDPVLERGTGKISPLAIRDAGALGSLLNHSEYRLTKRMLEKSINYANALGLDTVICTSSLEESIKVGSMEPSMIALELPELIAGDIPITKARPELITEVIDNVKRINPNIPILCGAGIKSGKDVARARDLGALGVLVSSGIILAKNWEEKIREFASNL